MTIKSAVLFPLYIYPFPGAWDPLYEAIQTYPQLDFTVVINPHNGPGAGIMPDGNYTREIPRLNGYANVRTIGYVRSDYARRPLADAVSDVSKYGTWVTNGGTQMGMHGIFVDETPNTYSDETNGYLAMLGRHVKTAEGILGDRLLVHNPGSVPDPRLNTPGPDVTVVVEDTITQFQSLYVQDVLSALTPEREKYCIMLHSATQEEIESLVQQVRQRAQYIFLTDLFSNYYQAFGAGWRAFVDALSKDEVPQQVAVLPPQEIAPQQEVLPQAGVLPDQSVQLPQVEVLQKA